MRILAGSRVIGLDQCPGFDCPQEALPRKLQILLCLVWTELNVADRFKPN